MGDLGGQVHGLLGWIVLAGAAAAVVAGWWRWVRPWWRDLRRDFVAGRDALVGRPPVRDSITGKELAPEIPGIGARMATVEQALVTMAQNHHTLTQLQELGANHEARIGKLEDAAVERVMGRAEAVAAWQAMHAAVQAEPEHDTPTTKE